MLQMYALTIYYLYINNYYVIIFKHLLLLFGKNIEKTKKKLAIRLD
jgi:hypothetical protein